MYGFIYYSLIVIVGIFLARSLQIFIFFLILSYQESAQIPRMPALTHTAEHKRPSPPPPPPTKKKKKQTSRTSQTLGRAFESRRKNQKLAQEFQKPSRVFLPQHGPCRPNQSRQYRSTLEIYRSRKYRKYIEYIPNRNI